MALKQAREHPLLNPPPPGRLWDPQIIPPSDAKLMLERLHKCRQEVSGSTVASLLVKLNEIGLDVQVTDDDVGMINRDIDNGIKTAESADGVRSSEVWWMIWDYYHLQKLSRPREITDDVRKIMYDKLEHERFLGLNFGVAALHFMLREIGLNTSVKGDELEKMVGKIDHFRNVGNGREVAFAIYHLKKLGVDITPSKEDEQLMWATLDEARTGAKVHLKGAMPDMYYYIKKLFYLDQPGSPDMPPLKKIA